MLLFGREPIDRPDLLLDAGDIMLRPPMTHDYTAWVAERMASRAFLQPWEPAWLPDELTKRAYRSRLRRYAQDVRQDQAYPFFIFRKTDGALLGGLGLTQVRRGAAAMAALGYWMGEAHAGQGHMSAAVRRLAAFSFNTLHLRRLEAACVPENQRSMHLLEKAGFEREGYARQYLEINGTWRDHLLYGLLMDGQLLSAD
jgi:[ribosomal protein S5]-alanine N-acetyltransferase